MIPKMFGTIKTELIALFNEWYVAISSIVVDAPTVVVTATTPFGEKEMPYREFNDTKPLEFNSVSVTSGISGILINPFILSFEKGLDELVRRLAELRRGFSSGWMLGLGESASFNETLISRVCGLFKGLMAVICAH